MRNTFRNCKSIILFTFAVIAMGATGASAATVTLNPTRALRFFNSTPNSNDTSSLSVYTDGEGQPFGQNQQRSLIQFDLSSVPAGSTINSATLTLVHDSALYPTGQPAGTTTQLFAVSKSWTNSATWDFASTGNAWTTPGGDGTGPFATNATTIPANSGVVAVPFAVTSLVSQWTAGTLSNNGVLLLGTYGDGLVFYASGNNAPSLAITYTPLPEPGSGLLIGALGCLVVRRRRI